MTCRGTYLYVNIWCAQPLSSNNPATIMNIMRGSLRSLHFVKDVQIMHFKKIFKFLLRCGSG